jgi:hypothetical protein
MTSRHQLGQVRVGNHDSVGVCSRCLMSHVTAEADRLCRRAHAAIGTPDELDAFRDLLEAVRAEQASEPPAPLTA